MDPDNSEPKSKSITKRKLDDVLNLLDDAFKEPATKKNIQKQSKVAQDVPESTPKLMKLLKRHKSSEGVQEGRGPKPSTSANTTTSNKQVADPLSLESLLQRLSTFRLATYSLGKPRTIDALAAARRGWVNQGDDPKERLECQSCQHAFRIEPPKSSSWSSEAGKKLAKTYADMLINEHATSCPWKTRQCPRLLYKLQPQIAHVLMTTLAKESCELEKIGIQKLPVCFPPNFNDNLERLKSILVYHIQRSSSSSNSLAANSEGNFAANVSINSSSFGELPEYTSTSLRSKVKLSNEAIILALLGWKVHHLTLDKESTNTDNLANIVIACPMCHRRAGLWSYVNQNQARSNLSFLPKNVSSSTPAIRQSASFGNLQSLRQSSPAPNKTGVGFPTSPSIASFGTPPPARRQTFGGGGGGTDSFASPTPAHITSVTRQRQASVGFMFGSGSKKPRWLQDDQSNQVPASPPSPSPSERARPPTTGQPPQKTFDPVSYHASTCPYVDIYVGLEPENQDSANKASSPPWISRANSIIKKYGYEPQIVSSNEGHDHDESLSRENGDDTSTNELNKNKDKANSREILGYVRNILGSSSNRRSS